MKINIPDDKKILIFGCGHDGKEFYHKYKSKYNIIGFIDSYSNNPQIYRPKDAAKLFKDSIVVVASSKYMFEMVKTMESYGFEMLDNLFIDYMFECQDKKIALIYGNCQTGIIKKFLMSSECFNDLYYIVFVPLVFLPDCKEYIKCLHKWGLLERLDLLIIQNIRDDNRFGYYLSTDNIVSLVGSECKVIKIPICSFTGYFPQHMAIPDSRIRFSSEDIPSGLFPYGDKNIESMFIQGLSKKEILEKVNNTEYYSEESITKCIKQSIAYLENHERNTDIKISDYIKNHYNEERLFYSCIHPCNNLLMELTNRILSYMELNLVTQDIKIDNDLQDGCEVIYPSVQKLIFKKDFNLLYYTNRFRKIEGIDTQKAYNFNEYLSLFLDVCYYDKYN